jgi:hypothetical protein
MIFGIFGNSKPPPLTALSTPENLLEMVDRMTAGPPSKIDKRAIGLSLVILGAAGHFISGLRWDKQKGMWEASQRYLRQTNLDVITAEATVWIHFLMGRLWQADQKKEHEMFERIGYTSTGEAFQLVLQMIKEQTGFDFKARAVESRKLYLDALKDRSVSFEPFATTVLRSVGCQSLAEPLKAVGPLPPLEWTPLTLNVATFFATMPLGFYETFKNFLRAGPERFPEDDDDDDFDGLSS